MTSNNKRLGSWFTQGAVDGVSRPNGDATSGEVVVVSALEGNRGGSFTVKSLDVTARDEMARLKSEGIGVVNSEPGTVFDRFAFPPARDVLSYLQETAPKSEGEIAQHGNLATENGLISSMRERR